MTNADIIKLETLLLHFVEKTVQKKNATREEVEVLPQIAFALVAIQDIK